MAVKTLPDVGTETKLSPMWRVLLHNDPVTPMDFVVWVLMDVFKKKLVEAAGIMVEAHERDVALIVIETREQAELHDEQTRSLARTHKYPLSISYEPA